MEGTLVGIHSQPTLLFMGHIIQRVQEQIQGGSVCFVLRQVPALLNQFSTKSQTLQRLYAIVEGCGARIYWRYPEEKSEWEEFQELSKKPSARLAPSACPASGRRTKTQAAWTGGLSPLGLSSGRSWTPAG